MRLAQAEARKGRGLTSPNPAVGAVLARNNRILARGFHRRAGEEHAEVDCLGKIAGPIPSESTLYVTLEPCSTRGRTEACVSYILERGVKRVVIGAVDPNPKHAGRAINLLRSGGVEVTVGVLAGECEELNEAFNKWIVTGRPFVIAKCGMTLDGRLTRPPAESQKITSPRARAEGRQLRETVDAVLVGAETVRRDNPRLTSRQRSTRPEPRRVILTRSGKLPAGARIFSQRGETIVLKGASPLEEILRELGRREMTSVLIEGGGEILTQALAARVIDKFHIYVAPLFSAGPTLAFAGRGALSTAEALAVHQVRYHRIGDDLRITAYSIPR